MYFKFRYTDALGTCVVYEEEFSSVDMTGSKGLASLELGIGVKTFPPAALTLYDVFNFGTPLSCLGNIPTPTVTPTAVERRKVIVQFNDGTGMQTLPIMNLNSVPFALHSTMANNSKQLGGFAASQYIKGSDILAAGCVAGQALRYTGVSFVCENIPGVSVTSVTATSPVVSSGGAAPIISMPKATSSVNGYLGSSDWSVFNGKLSNFSTLTSNDVTTALGYTPGSSALSGDVTGTLTATVIATVGGVSAANVATAANLANAATSANAASTIVRRNASGDFTAGTINATTFSGTNSSATNVSTQNIYLYDSVNTNRILFKAPAAGITNYTLTLPPTAGTNGQVLSTNASGDLSWANASGGSVTTVTASAPLASSGGATPNVTISRASATVDGYLASSDFSIFNSKLSNFSTMTSLDVTTALTFIPLNRASNLSDLTNVTTARTNLGLGTAAVLNGASSGDATATELVKGNDSRLTDSRAPSGAASGDLTGTYPNPTLKTTGVSAGSYSRVTVDAKGRVTAGVTSLDLTTSVSGTLPIANGGTGQTTAVTGFNALSPLTTKGDLLTRDGTDNIRLPVGANGLVLKTNSSTASGLEWAAASAGTVGTVTATAPLVSSGGASPDISLAKASATVDGYLASSDWSIFNSKLSNFSTMTSVDVTTALTFIPLNRASNLSDLANTTTARSNLGLGTAAVLNGASSGDATAAELVKGNDSRLTDSRAPSGAASGDLSGTYPNPTLTNTGVVASTDYTKVTVDAKGRITSAGRLNSADLTGLYGYTPANSNAAWALNGSGDVSRTTGNVGIGTTDPTAKLHVNGRMAISGPVASTLMIGGGNDTATGSETTVVGVGAGAALTSGSHNTFLGYSVGGVATTASGNTFLGHAAGGAATSAGNNVIIGNNSGARTTSASHNVFIGQAAGFENDTGSKAVAVGRNALNNFIAAGNTYNVAIGESAMIGVFGSSTGVNNTAVGGLAGASISTGSNNILIGYNTNTLTATTSNYINIGNTLYGDSSLGYIGIGITSASYPLQVSGDISISGNYKVNGVNIGSGTVGSVTAAATTGNPITVSASTTSPSIDITRATASVNGYLGSSDFSTFYNKLTQTLNSGSIFVGNVSNIATAQVLSGDATIDNAGILTLVSNSVTGAKILDGTITSADLSSSVANALWSVNGSGDVSRITGNVGIGTTGPTNLLHINNGSGTSAGLRIDTVNATGGNGGGLVVNAPSGSNHIILESAGVQKWVQYLQGNDLRYYGAGSDRVTFQADGMVGIGTSSPVAGLDVVRSDTSLLQIRNTDPNAYSEMRMLNSANNVSLHALTFGYSSSGYAGFGGLTGEFGWFGTNGNYPFGIFTNNAMAMTVLGNGNVGIGTTAPGAPLDVKGAIRLSGATSGYTGFQPAANAGSTVWILPAVDGTNGQVLATNGSGDLSWATASGGGVTSVTASAPLASSGGATPNIIITRSSASVDGYLASSDFTIFNNKLGTATAFSGDVTGTYNATVLANSGVTAGTYAGAVTVDAKGRVTAAVASLDLTNGVSGILPIANGGTNASSFANTYGVNYFDGTRLVTSPAGAANQMLVQTVGGPVWTTATYPSTTTAKQLMYSSATNTVSGLATANSSVLTTNASGDPTWSTIVSDLFSQYVLLAGRAGGQTIKGGTLASQDLTLDSTAHTNKGNVIINPSGGSVGIGRTPSSNAKLEVDGQILAKVYVDGSSATTFDWSRGNMITTNSSCGAFTFTNMLEGGSYTLIVTGATSGTCTFSQTSPDTLSTWKFLPTNAATTASTTTIYSFVRANNIVYVSWMAGF